MAKRQTATEKWDDPWFCELDENNKLFWLYILDKCDHAGIWQVNWKLVQFHIKNFAFNPDLFRDRIVEISPTKWFIPKFIGFQYLTLNPDNRVHQSVISRLQKEGVWKGLGSPFQGAKDKDKDKDKDKTKKRSSEEFRKPTLQQIEDYSKTERLSLDARRFFDYYESKGWVVGRAPMRDWRAAARNWKSNEPEKPKEVDFA